MHPARIDRERIAERLRRSSERRVALVVAGAGFGKSIAVAQALDVAGGDVFYRVAPDTSTLLAFLRGLTDALEAKVPGAHLSLAIAHERAIQSPAPAVELARWLGEHLREAPPLRIVIDDLHNATAPEVTEFLRASVEAAPEHVRWLLVARDADALPVASWLAHGIAGVPLDESELRFTPDEIAALATHSSPRLNAERIALIVERTAGWPAATGLALSIGNAELPAARETPLATYTALADCVLAGIAEPERTALLMSSVTADISDGLFRDFLLAVLRSAGPGLERHALLASAEASERNGNVRAALAYYRRAGEAETVSRLLSVHGIALTDGGFADVVEAAIAMLDRGEFDGGPALMLLKALRDARFARFDSAEAWFQLAIAAAPDDHDLRLRIVHRYALDLIRRGRIDAIKVVEPAVQSAPHGHAMLPLLNATLATGYALVDRFDDARTAIASAMADLSPALPDALRTRALHQAAYVALRCDDIPEARRYAERVLEAAVPAGFYDLAARAHSILYEIAHAWDAEPKRALAHVELVAAFGLKSGDTHIRQWALLSAYYIEAERGNAAMMRTIERALNAFEVLQTTEETSATLLPGQALRATWSGDFAHAFRLMTGSSDQVSASRRAARWGQIALFGAASGAFAEAREAAAAAQRELAEGYTGKFAMQAAAFLLLSLSLVGDRMTWLTVQKMVRGHMPDTPARLFVQCAEALQNHWFERRDHASVLAIFDALREHGFGGIATMLEALPAYPANLQQTLP